MLKVVLAALAALYAGPAFAGEALLKGPPAAWVKPLAIQVPAIGDDGPAVRSLLQDQELRLGDGGEAEYVQRAFQVRTPLGLMGAGSLTLAWNPATDTLTVHHVHILRDGKVIDVLAKQDFAIIRRENNLDRAMLDGVLSATLQPEGLQAGDVVDLAYTRAHLDPVMQGRIEHRLAGPAFGRIDRLRLRAVWDPKLDLAWTAGEGLEKPKVTRTAHEMEVVVDMKDVDSVKFPAGAPARFWPTRELSVSGFHGWEEVAGLMTPIFEKAAVLEPESPLRAEVARIKAASDDPKIRAGLALQLVEDKVRYLALTMGEGGYVPQTPDDTWRRRFGDCKAKSVLLATLLRELGVTAELALVDSDGGDFLAARPPGVTAFDHVIVRATIGGKVYWLDGTRLGDRNVEAVRTPPFGQALPLRVAGAQLIPLLQPPPDRPDNTLAFRIDASKGIDAPAPIHAEASMGGNMAMYFNVFAGSMGSADRDKMLKGFWKAYPWVEPTTVTLVQDTETGSARMVMDGVAKLPWLDGPGERMWVLPWAHLGSMATYKRDPPGPHDDAPFLMPGYPSYDTFRLEVKLPWKGEGFHIEGGDVDATAAGQHLVRHSTLTGEVAIVEVSTRTLAPEFPASEAQAAATKLNEIGRTGVWLRAPALYRETPEDVAALAQQTPKTASDFVNRAVRFGRGGRGDQGLADLNKAIELDPKSSYAYANRATIYMQQGRAKEAAADLAKALELDPRNYVAVQVQAMTALREGRYDEALSGFTRAADLIPHNTHAQLMRAQVYAAMRQPEKALAVLDDLDKAEPGLTSAALLRASVHAGAGHPDRALATLDALKGNAANDLGVLFMRATSLSRLERRDEADAAFDKWLAAQPTAEAYLTRASYRDPDDIAGRLADIDKAEKLSPGLAWVAQRRAATLADAGRIDEGLAVVAAALKAHAADVGLLTTRAALYAQAHRDALARADFAVLRAKAAGSAPALNGLCWTQATHSFDLTQALADCDAALALDAKAAAILDSRAFVLLRLGRLEEALSAYDAALALRPDQADSLYGRGVTRLRLGRAADGAADLATARAFDPVIAKVFARYGVTAPDPGAQATRPAAVAPALAGH